MNIKAKHWLGNIARLVIAIANIVIAAGFVASAWGGTVNPNESVVWSILSLTFPAFLILMLVALIVNLICFRKLAMFNIVVMLACISPILTYCPMNFFRPSEKSIAASGEKTLKLLTFNILDLFVYGDHKPETEGNPTMEYILKSGADVVVMQEATDVLTPGFQGVSDGQHEELLDLYPYRDVTFRGMAILSKYPFEKVDVDSRDPSQLDLCRYDLNVGDGEVVHVFNVHMQSIGLTAEDKEVYVQITEGEAADEADEIRHSLLSKLASAFRSRADQAEDIRQALDEVDGDVILAGDFNDIPGSYAYRTVAGSDMTDAYREAGLGPAITYHADRFYFRIDQIFYRGGLDALRVWRGDCSTSDHYPLLAIFKIEDKKTNN